METAQEFDEDDEKKRDYYAKTGFTGQYASRQRLTGHKQRRKYVFKN